jgi:hypothetical protein
MTESSVTYVAPNRTDAGAVPKNTVVATHDRQSDGAEVQDVFIDPNSVIPLPTGAATSANQTNGTQLSRIVDADGHQVNVQAVTAALDGTEYGAVTNAIIHGKSTAGGGIFVDVKVSPSGAVQVGGDLDSVGSITNTVTTTRADDFYNDSFGRLRTSDTGQRFDVEFTHDAMPLIMETVTSGGATVAHNATTRDVTLSIVNATNGTTATFASRYHVPYTPGNSQLIDITGALNPQNIAGGAASFFIRNNGSEVETPQASWTGAANVSTINFRYSQILVIDFQSLKVGRIRFGFSRSGVPVLAHVINNDNIRVNGYWQYPSLRPYWRIYNSGGNTIMEKGYGDATNGVGLRYTIPANASATMNAICATVKSEGGKDLFDLDGFPFGISNRVTAKTVSTTLIPVLSIQVQTTFNSLTYRGIVIPNKLTLMCDNPINYRVFLNPTLTGASFVQTDANSAVYYDVTASAISGGILLDDDYAASGGTRSAVTKSIGGKVPLSVNYAGTAGDILTIAAIRTGTTNATTNAAVGWIETR